MRLHQKPKALHRLTATMLGLCIAVSTLGQTGLLALTAQAAGPTQNVLDGTRVADPNTMDSYIGKLLSDGYGSRYAGRVWTDKTVFANGATADKGGVTGNEIPLDMDTDGYDKDGVRFTADFGHVFSALASSQVVNEYPPSPIDLVIVFDMSGSMGQDTRFGIDSGGNSYQEHNKGGDTPVEDGGAAWPADGVPMADRIANSRVQATLTAINNTIDGLMKQNPQNRVAVCGYGANATVLMPLAHYRHQTDGDGNAIPYLTVGGMETLYHPSDLVYKDAPEDGEPGWYWQNNRDTCYTVVVNAQKNEWTDPLEDNQTWDNLRWDEFERTVSNNVNSDGVKAFPGVADPATETSSQDIIQASQDVYAGAKANEYTAGTDQLIDAMKATKELKADDYVGYFTNTQGGIYLAYKQLADSAVTTYTETLTNGTVSTVARIPAAIIMSDGGANFAFNEMKDYYEGFDDPHETVQKWESRFGRLIDMDNYGTEEDKKFLEWTDPKKYRTYENQGGKPFDPTWYLEDNVWPSPDIKDPSNPLFPWGGRNEDVKHRLGVTDGVPQAGNEWYNVYLPGPDTLRETPDHPYTGLHSIYNSGADYYQDGTLSTQPNWDNVGVLYSSDNDPVGTPGTVLEVLFTAAYMNDVVKEHYTNGWNANQATEGSRVPLSTFTMNVDTAHVPQWGRMRLYPTLDPKDYPLDDIVALVDAQPGKFAETFGAEEWGTGTWDANHNTVYGGIYREWGKLKEGNVADNLSMTGNPIRLVPISRAEEPNAADYKTQSYRDGVLTDEVIQVDDADVLSSIAYNDQFYDVDSESLSDIFDEILEIILGKVFVPVSGDNDAGVGDSITYQDPIGEYMEVKNGSITATPYHTDGKLGETNPTTYDMAMLLFGEMHGLVRAGVYDFQWNDAWIGIHDQEHQGTAAMQEGWYLGADPADAKSGGDGDVPTGPDVKQYNNANEARADGWVYRLNFKTVQQYVPILGETLVPSDLPAQVKNTVYTVYRFNCDDTEREALRRNPIYGEVPQTLLDKWADPATDKTTNSAYADTPGVYRLSDIRVWIEDTGDFVDTDGAFVPNSGYDRCLYLNIPAAAVPTQLAEITLGRDGVLSYKTNLGTDHTIGSTDIGTVDGEEKEITVDQEAHNNYCYQSTPLRLFYAVGVEDAVLKPDGSVDISALSAEYVASHTDPDTSNIYFISNYYSNTPYTGYVTDTYTGDRTRGDPTVTFSPSVDNRYYVYQKPLPLYAHAYRVKDGTLHAVDDQSKTVWPEADNPYGGNNGTVWENAASGAYGGAAWGGGEYMGTYEDEASFKAALAAAKSSPDNTITDAYGMRYPVAEDGVVFLKQDLLDRVKSKSGTDDGYTEDSVAFGSDDWFFMIIDYYLPNKDETGMDLTDKEVPGTCGGRTVQYVVARKGSEFGSAYHSENIDNGDMLCWTDMDSGAQTEYFSRSATGDNTRGEPTWEKLTYGTDDLQRYLAENGVTNEKTVTVPDTDNPGSTKKIGALEQQVQYWTELRKDPQIAALIEKVQKAAAEEYGGDAAKAFADLCQWAVAAKPGGLRVGDMANNIQSKAPNTTGTAYNYYIPTVSANSGTGNNVLLDSYLGNNGRLEVANAKLLVTKLLEPPEGLALTDEQEDESFLYQLYVQGLTGQQSATLVHYNPFSQSWQHQIAYIDVLTDNSSLLQDASHARALFDYDGDTARQVVLQDGTYYYANADGTANMAERCSNQTLENFYYLYLPSDGAAGSDTDTSHARRLYQDPDYKGDDIVETNKGNHLTIYYGDGQEPSKEQQDADKENGIDYRPVAADRPAGTFAYWAEDAELIPVTEVQAAEALAADLGGDGPSTIALESSGGSWSHDTAVHGEDHKEIGSYTLVVSKPEAESSESNVTSPFDTRTTYMTKTLNFGQNAEENYKAGDGSKASGALDPSTDLYDGIIPKGDRADLFSGLDNAQIAQNTAEFTLKSGQGLLLTGLRNSIVYRFTEKLTTEQLEKGYTLKQVSHVQQRGSDSVYKPGVQQIPVYHYDGAAYGSCYPAPYQSYPTEDGLTWAIDKDGNPTSDAYRTLETFDHANAVMWEYYTTVGEGEPGHHHPAGAGAETADFYNQNVKTGVQQTVGVNPSCTALDRTDLAAGGCDEVQPDGTTRHYVYVEGQLIDPHYEGEASAYLRRMSRFIVNPTAHFGVNGETQTAAESGPPYTAPAADYEYTGVYSVFGDTGYFEEQAHYTNTFQTGDIAITKKLGAADGAKITEEDKKSAFSFTLTLDTGASVGTSDGVYNYVITDEDGNEVKTGRLLPHDYRDKGGDFKEGFDIEANDTANTTWTFTLQGGQTMTVQGLPVDTGYTYKIEETTYPGYTVTDSDTATPSNDGTVTGTVPPGLKEPVEVAFTNTKKPPEPTTRGLSLTKNATDYPQNLTGGEFSFQVTPNSENPKDDPIQDQPGWDGTTLTVQNAAPGTDNKQTADAVIFPSTTQFTQVGTYRYTVREVIPNDPSIPGISYDSTIYNVTITVREQYEDGVYTGKLETELTVNGVKESDARFGGIVFNNSYSTSEVSVVLRAFKAVEAADGTHRLLPVREGDYTFTLTGVSQAPLPGGDAPIDGPSMDEALPQNGPTLEEPPQSDAPAPDDGATSTPAPDPQATADPTAAPDPQATTDPTAVPDPADATPEPTQGPTPAPQGTPEPEPPHGKTAPATQGEDSAPADTQAAPPAGDAPAQDSTATGTPQQGDPAENDAATGTPPQEDGPVEGDGTPPLAPLALIGDLPPMPSTDNTATAATGADGYAYFGAIKYTEEGVYTYQITETAGSRLGVDYDAAVYNVTVTVTKDTASGALQAAVKYEKIVGDTPTAADVAAFTNTQHVGGLTVHKTVAGSGDKTREFQFTVTLTDADGTTLDYLTGRYGAMQFTNGVATFTLHDGDSLTAADLPVGAHYTVTETDYAAEGYTTTYEGNVGTVTENTDAEVEVTNYLPDGELTVRKTVTGNGDKTREFNFTVTFAPVTAALEKAVVYKNGAPAPELHIVDGVLAFTLHDGEHVRITGLPAGVTYVVAEAEANRDGYTTSSRGAAGTVTGGGSAEAAFVNDMPPPPPPPPPAPRPGPATTTPSACGWRCSWPRCWGCWPSPPAPPCAAATAAPARKRAAPRAMPGQQGYTNTAKISADPRKRVGVYFLPLFIRPLPLRNVPRPTPARGRSLCSGCARSGLRSRPGG